MLRRRCVQDAQQEGAGLLPRVGGGGAAGRRRRRRRPVDGGQAGAARGVRGAGGRRAAPSGRGALWPLIEKDSASPWSCSLMSAACCFRERLKHKTQVGRDLRLVKIRHMARIMSTYSGMSARAKWPAMGPQAGMRLGIGRLHPRDAKMSIGVHPMHPKTLTLSKIRLASLAKCILGMHRPQAGASKSGRVHPEDANASLSTSLRDRIRRLS